MNVRGIMEKEKSVLLECFGSSPLVRVVDFLLDNRLFDYTKKQIAEGSGIGRVTLFQHWKEIEALGVVKETRRFGKTKLYKLDEKNPVVKKFIELELTLAEQTGRKLTAYVLAHPR